MAYPQSPSSEPVKPQRMRGNRPAYTTETLLDVAVTVFTSRGYEGTSMEDLAAAAGLSKSSIYHHVQGKQQLLGLALDRALDGLFAVLTQPGATTGPAVDRLTHVIRGTVGVLLDELPYVTLLLRVRGNSPIELAALARRREFDQLVAQPGAAGPAARRGGPRPGRRRRHPADLRHDQLADRVVPARPRRPAGPARDGGAAGADRAGAPTRNQLTGGLPGG